jgi:hypothetical protein
MNIMLDMEFVCLCVHFDVSWSVLIAMICKGEKMKARYVPYRLALKTEAQARYA